MPIGLRQPSPCPRLSGGAGLQGRGLGRRVVEALLASPKLRKVERVYLMTTNSNGFYEQMGFDTVTSQHLLIRKQ